MKYLIALCLVVSAFAQAPKPCDSPPQWEAREIRQDYSRKFEEFRKLSYDETNRRVREVEEILLGSDKEYVDRLYLYNEAKNYSLNLKTKVCTVTALTRPFRHRGVFPGAKFDGIFNIGAVGVSGEVVAVQAFSANGTDGFYTGLVTYPSCYPVQNLFFSKANGFEHSDYFDLNIGIVDLNVFVPPQECIKAEEEMNKKKIMPVTDYEQKYQEYRRLSYDETNKRERQIAEVDVGGDKAYYDRLILYNENKNYTLNLKTRICTVSAINRPFHYRGVHPNAKFDGLFELGAVGVPGEVVAVQAFSANETNEYYTGLVTYPSCYPVQNLHFSKTHGFEHSDYFDLHIGITDLNVFVPPTECLKAEKSQKISPVV
ncbi:unnamed protein product [Mytilus edulis]|uniref:Mammalian ependymin-related protein 1 n=2 Tax=Mytilus TaxID=6548 RepID=A0A8S3T3E7_MYTED|nr:unnamed protein product [Mytilus edulis]